MGCRVPSLPDFQATGITRSPTHRMPADPPHALQRGLVRGSALSSPPQPEQLSGSALACGLSHSCYPQRHCHLRPSWVLEAEKE